MPLSLKGKTPSSFALHFHRSLSMAKYRGNYGADNIFKEMDHHEGGSLTSLWQMLQLW